MRVLKSLFKILKHLSIKLAKTAIVLVVLLLIISGILSAFLKQELHSWHSTSIEGEFTASLAGSDFNFKNYLELEDKLFDNLESYFVSKQEVGTVSTISRYLDGGVNNPSFFKTNWNRTQILEPNEIKGGALMIHGLSDSPYSLRATAEEFKALGYYVVVLRMPGHGTIPKGLIDVHWSDWTAAVDVAAKHVLEKIDDKPFVIAGYSNGGALALHYTTEALLNNTRAPEGLLLMSPAIAVSPLAVVSNWHKLITWIPHFEKNKWLSILPEIDPYKYNSFTKNAGAQIFGLTRSLRRNIASLTDNNKIEEMSKMLTFQSAVDATIPGEMLVSELYLKLIKPNSELVIYDVLNSTQLKALFAANPRSEIDQIAEHEISFDFTLIGNIADRKEVTAATRMAGSTNFSIEQTNMLWPQGVFSLSHVAIPFSPKDPIYGNSPNHDSSGRVSFGNIAPRGETGVLLLSADLLLRLRYNPFFSYQQKRIAHWGESLLRE